MAKQLLTAKEASEIIGCHSNHIYILIDRGDLIGIDMGKGEKKRRMMVPEESAIAYAKVFKGKLSSRARPASNNGSGDTQGVMFAEERTFGLLSQMSATMKRIEKLLAKEE